MKRTFAVLIIFSLIITGCKRNVPVKEGLTNYGDESTVYMPYVESGNPGLDGTINGEIKKRLTDAFQKTKNGRDGRTTEGFTAFQTGDLLSIFHEGYFEPAGQSGDSYLTTLHINIRTGTFYELSDLFIPGYEQKLSAIVSESLSLSLNEYYMAYSIDLQSVAFDVFADEIIFIFNPGEVAPDNMGFIDAPLTFSQIDHLINKEGEFYKVIMAGSEK